MFHEFSVLNTKSVGFRMSNTKASNTKAVTSANVAFVRRAGTRMLPPLQLSMLQLGHHCIRSDESLLTSRASSFVLKATGNEMHARSQSSETKHKINSPTQSDQCSPGLPPYHRTITLTT